MSPAEQTEIERKYDVDETAVVPDLVGTTPRDPSAGGAGRDLRVAHVDVDPPAHLAATYHDAPGRPLLGGRVTLRRRTGGHDAGWHLKLPPTGPGAGRREVHAPLGEADDGVPAELLDRVADRLDGRDVAPVLVLETTRTAHRLRAADGTELAELADDAVSATEPETGTRRSWREWEVELAPGLDGADGEALLVAVEAVLRSAGAVPSSSRSKLARGLGEEPLPGA